MSSWLARGPAKKPFKPIEIKPAELKNDITRQTPTQNTFDSDTLKRIDLFNLNNSDALITFIIPTINRLTLINSLFSLKNQKINNWKAIVIFDGSHPNKYPEIYNLLTNDSRFLYISIPKMGSINNSTGFFPHNSAGKVRNIGMNLVTTPWIGFLDDDDTLIDKYTDKLMEEIVLNPSAELVIFRMRDREYIFPPPITSKLEHGKVGISFSLKTQLVKDGYLFQQSEKEDFDFINNIVMLNKKIVISPYITYQVRDYKTTTDQELTRTIIN
jgi:glycosyltransferase involved in cell wall biosynthesis